MKLQSIVGKPFIRRTQYRPAVLVIQFPSGDVWEYHINDDTLMDTMLRKYGKNVGRLVSMLKKYNIKATKQNEA